MILTGIAVGVHPLISYYFGARNRSAILEMVSIAFKTVTLVGAAVFILVHLAGRGMIGFFAKDNTALLQLAGTGLKLYSLAFLVNGYNIIAAAYFTSISQAKEAAVISTLRSLILVNLLVLFLPVFCGESGIWLATPLTELITFALSYRWIQHSKRSLLVNDSVSCEAV
jgi:Na+-driven multidrug efflux pump